MRSNAEILAKVVMDIKTILDNERVLLHIENVLADELDSVAKTRNQELIQDLLLTIENADAVRTAQRIQAGCSRLRLVTRENEIA